MIRPIFCIICHVTYFFRPVVKTFRRRDVGFVIIMYDGQSSHVVVIVVLSILIVVVEPLVLST